MNEIIDFLSFASVLKRKGEIVDYDKASKIDDEELKVITNFYMLLPNILEAGSLEEEKKILSGLNEWMCSIDDQLGNKGKKINMFRQYPDLGCLAGNIKFEQDVGFINIERSRGFIDISLESYVRLNFNKKVVKVLKHLVNFFPIPYPEDFSVIKNASSFKEKEKQWPEYLSSEYFYK